MVTGSLIASLVFLGLTVLGFVIGLGSSQAGLIVASLFCAMPLFMFTIGLTIGRASKEFRIERNIDSMSQRATNRSVKSLS